MPDPKKLGEAAGAAMTQGAKLLFKAK